MLKYINFTKLDHLESILINFCALLEKNSYFNCWLKLLAQLNETGVTNLLTWKSCELCTNFCRARNRAILLSWFRTLIQTVHFAKILHEKYWKLEYSSNDNPSNPICRWRKRYFGKKLFENTNFSTLKYFFQYTKNST